MGTWGLPLLPEFVAWWVAANIRSELLRSTRGIVRKPSNAEAKAIGFLCLTAGSPDFALLLAVTVVDSGSPGRLAPKNREHKLSGGA